MPNKRRDFALNLLYSLLLTLALISTMIERDDQHDQQPKAERNAQ